MSGAGWHVVITLGIGLPLLLVLALRRHRRKP